MARQILPVFWLPSDLDALKRSLIDAARGTDLGVQACAALPDATRAAWGVFYAGVVDWCRSSTPLFGLGTEANIGEGMQDALYQWQLKLQAAGCTLGAPAVNPQPAEAPGSSVLKWLALAAIVGAGAYVAHEVAETVKDLE
jgi:hypothetical protein